MTHQLIELAIADLNFADCAVSESECVSDSKSSLPASSWNSRLTLDGLTSTMCTTIKGHGIIIYTIRFDSSGKTPNDPNDSTTTMLKNCASLPSDYFYSPNATQLQTAFTQIGQQLSSLRLSQ